MASPLDANGALRRDDRRRHRRSPSTSRIDAVNSSIGSTRTVRLVGSRRARRPPPWRTMTCKAAREASSSVSLGARRLQHPGLQSRIAGIEAKRWHGVVGFAERQQFAGLRSVLIASPAPPMAGNAMSGKLGGELEHAARGPVIRWVSVFIVTLPGERSCLERCVHWCHNRCTSGTSSPMNSAWDLLCLRKGFCPHWHR